MSKCVTYKLALFVDNVSTLNIQNAIKLTNTH